MKHPYYDYTTEDALSLARDLIYGPLPKPSDPTPSPEEALAAVEDCLHHCGHTWITGEIARDLLQIACGQQVRFTG